MPLRVLALLPGILALALVGCSVPLPTPADQNAYVGQVSLGCAPHDAASVELRLLTLGDSEILHLNIWGDLPLESGRRVVFDTDTFSASAAVCTSSGDCQGVEWGEVVFEEFHPNQAASGSVTLGLPSGRVLGGSFAAAWTGGLPLCG